MKRGTSRFGGSCVYEDSFIDKKFMIAVGAVVTSEGPHVVSVNTNMIKFAHFLYSSALATMRNFQTFLIQFSHTASILSFLFWQSGEWVARANE